MVRVIRIYILVSISWFALLTVVEVDLLSDHLEILIVSWLYLNLPPFLYSSTLINSEAYEENRRSLAKRV